MTSYDTDLDTELLVQKPQASQTRRDDVPERSRVYSAGLKHALDVALVLMTLPIVLPLIAILALLISFDRANPFYSQLRVGRNGRHYRMWKLRSMVPDAETCLEAYLSSDPAARAEWDAMQKLRNDPRITRVGNFIRKTSLDELPQLFNVLIGDMSLVGPRPMMVSQQPLYPGEAYFALRPGITGAWQISDRNNTTFSARAEFDADYLDDLSFGTDVRILASTVRVVAKGTGC